jgi:WD40 repeat protein
MSRIAVQSVKRRVPSVAAFVCILGAAHAVGGEIEAQFRSTFHGHTNNVVSLAFSPDGKILASASIDGTIKLWPLSTSRKALTLDGHTGCVDSIAYTGDGRFLVSGGKDKTVRLWDATTGREIIVLVEENKR